MHKEITARIIVRDEEGRFLLVHEMEEGGVGRPAGWNQPGGRIEAEESKEKMRKEIARFPHRDALYEHLDRTIQDGLDRCFMGATREVLEETGYLVRINRELCPLREEYAEHEVRVYDGEVVVGELVKRSPETNNAGWFLPSEMPFPDEDANFLEGLYPSARVRFTRACKFFAAEEQEREAWCRDYAAWAERVSDEHEMAQLH